MKITTTKTVFASLLLPVLILAGCATPGPPPQYYTLTPVASTTTGPNSEIAVGIGPFRFPEYLKRPQMVTRTAGAGVRLEESHRWVESLQGVFMRTLATNVSRQLGSDAVFEFPAHADVGARNRVGGTVQRFDVDEDGRAVMEVQWAIFDRAGEIIDAGRRARYEAVAADAGDFAARADALSTILEAFGTDVAAALFRLARGDSE